MRTISTTDVKAILIAGLCSSVALTGMAAEGGDIGYSDTPLVPGTEWHIHDGDRPQPPVVTPGTTFSHAAPPPSDAIVLFDGNDLSKWKGADWKVENGYMEVVPGSGSIRTKEKFGDFQLHLEFATPWKGEGSSQHRGNSGLLINHIYEIQILDSYHNKTYPDGQAGAIYGQTPPLRNASKPSGAWQTYDVIFEVPRWNDEGELTKKAYVTVIHNGVILHHRRAFMGKTSHRSIPEYEPHPPEVFLELQDHNNPTRFRNIWIRPLGQYDEKEQ